MFASPCLALLFWSEKSTIPEPGGQQHDILCPSGMNLKASVSHEIKAIFARQVHPGKKEQKQMEKKREKAKPMARLILVIKLILGKWNLLWLRISPTFLIQNKVPLIFYDLCYFDESWIATYLTKFHPSHLYSAFCFFVRVFDKQIHHF